MSYSYTQSSTQTFTITHARYLASKVSTDLKRIQRFYSLPSDQTINRYETEIIELLKNGYLDYVIYGFQKNDLWIEPTLRYTAKDLGGMLGVDDDPGKIKPGADVNGAFFTSFLSYSPSYHSLSTAHKELFEKSLPFQRGFGNVPGISGYLINDKSYSSGGKGLDRSYVKNL